MAEYNLNKMNRKELLELLLQQISENEKMKEKIEILETQISVVQNDCKKKLADRRIEISKAGSMAEAALRLNKVFADADLAVQQYQENVKRSSDNAKALAKSIVDETNRKANAILIAARNEAEKMRTNALVSARSTQEKAKKEAEAIIADAQRQAINIRTKAAQYQKDAGKKMTESYSTYKDLQSITGASEDETL